MTPEYILYSQLSRVRKEIQNVETRQTDAGLTEYKITFKHRTDSELYPSFDISACDMDTCKTFVQCYYDKFARMPGDFVYNAALWGSFCNFIGSMSRKRHGVD